jgi:diguanylate cyclase (GGDEF)-like protein
VQNFAIPFIAVTWLFVAKRFTSYSNKLFWKKELLYMIIPILLFISSQLHYFTPINWYYNTYEIIQYQGFFGYSIDILILEKAFMYYVGQAYSLLIIGYVAYLYIKRALEVKGIQKKQAIGLAISGILASILVIPAFFSRYTSNIDLTLYYLSIIGYMILYSVYHYELLTLMPLVNKSLFKDANSPILIFDDKFDLIEWNSKVSVFDFIVPKYQNKINEVIKLPKLVESIKLIQPFSFDYNDKHFVVEVLDLVNKNEKPIGYVVHFLEMSIFAERINKLDFLASHDQLTNTLNRNGFYDRFNHFIENIDVDSAFTFLMYDFDDFKDVNDYFGHLGGDLVLKETSKLISEFLPSDSLLCRFGGEEFLIFIPHITLLESLDLAEKMRVLIENQNLIYQGKTIKTSISIGIYNCTKSIDSNLDSLIEKADKALYKSKKEGKNKVSTFD